MDKKFLDKLLKLTDNFKNKKIGVIGDLMLDHFIVGDTDRISPEAPVPVVHAKEEILGPGGAGNVASNIAALDGKVYLVGLLGSDIAAGQLFHEFKIRKVNTGCVIKVPGPTIQKIRRHWMTF